jgi:hypothetical protein
LLGVILNAEKLAAVVIRIDKPEVMYYINWLLLLYSLNWNEAVGIVLGGLIKFSMKNGDDASCPARTEVEREEKVSKRVIESKVQETLNDPAWQV